MPYDKPPRRIGMAIVVAIATATTATVAFAIVLLTIIRICRCLGWEGR